MKSCIARSAYNYFISELKNETLVSMSTAFDKALKNKGIAFFLAQKARTEGASEYEIINDWIRLLATTPREDARKTIDAECEVLQVEYQSRQYIANEVLNLCSFNSDGQCRISLSAPLGLDQEQLIPNYI